MTTREEADAP